MTMHLAPFKALEAMMKAFTIAAVLFLYSVYPGGAFAQNASSVVTSATADATARVIADAVRETAIDALQPAPDAGPMKPDGMKAKAEKASDTTKGDRK